MAHEPLHQDVAVANYEEAIHQSLESLVYLHHLARHPWARQVWQSPLADREHKGQMRLHSGSGLRFGLYRSNANRVEIQ